MGLLKHLERMFLRGRDGLLGSEEDEGLEKRWGAKIMQDDHMGRVSRGWTGKPRALLRLSPLILAWVPGVAQWFSTCLACMGPRHRSQHLAKGKQLSEHLSNYSGRAG